MDFRAGSSPVARTNIKGAVLAAPFIFSKRRAGLEPIAVELSGGQFLPPVQTLVATIIFCKAENANQVLSFSTKSTLVGARNIMIAFLPENCDFPPCFL
ncbi:MAG: hypothetical protein IJX37_00140 [Oscillospiraceae bacterium]|nr:hypothetical protein [Oscillospiraceae bacterium]